MRRAHARLNRLVCFTPVFEAVNSGHQPPMFSPSIGVMLPDRLWESVNDDLLSNSKSS